LNIYLSPKAYKSALKQIQGSNSGEEKTRKEPFWERSQLAFSEPADATPWRAAHTLDTLCTECPPF